jgi:antirestriction protein ArdC
MKWEALRVLAFDPGEMTGYFFIELSSVDAAKDSLLADAGYESGAFSGWEGVSALIERLRPKHIVVEEFRLRPQRARVQYNRKMAASEVIGAIRTAAEAAGVPVHMMPPAEEKPVQAYYGSTYRQIRGKHARAAFRVAARYLMGLWTLEC